MTLNKLKHGMTVYSVSRTRLGNTKRKTVSVYPVRIIHVDYERGIVQASWNNNYPNNYGKKQWSKWRLEEPMLVRQTFGERLATRAEIKAAKEKGNQ